MMLICENPLAYKRDPEDVCGLCNKNRLVLRTRSLVMSPKTNKQKQQELYHLKSVRIEKSFFFF